MTVFHQEKSTDFLKMCKELWTELIKISDKIGTDKCPSLEPKFVQQFCSAMLESKVFPVEAESQSERQSTVCSKVCCGIYFVKCEGKNFIEASASAT